MIDTSQLNDWIRKVEAVQRDLKPTAEDALEEIGEKFLDLVCTEIRAAENVDTRLLLSSFHRGSANNIFELDGGSMKVTVGSAVDYAAYVNDGHAQQPGRFIPGVFDGNGTFRYEKGAKGGMVLKASYVYGSHYFDKAVFRMDGYTSKIAEEWFDALFSRYFG